VYQAKNRKQWQLALERAEKLVHMQNKCARLEETTKAKERIESELRIAREIQKRMLPPAREVGGDLYAYALLDNLLYFCVGDAEPSDDLTKMCIKMK
jgi:serine phosphatase RsbU (regulator of sigma subunit)